MSKPIVITIGRAESPDLRFTCTRVGEAGEVFSTFDVLVEYQSPEGLTPALFNLKNFPRADGTDGLALFLLEWWTAITQFARIVDPDRTDNKVRFPTAEEIAANPIIITEARAALEISTGPTQ